MFVGGKIMNEKIYTATNDLIFKKVFGENEIIVQDFLSSILKIPKDEFEIIYYENPFMNISDVADDKIGILDIKIKTKSGMLCNIEMQVEYMEGMRKRIVWYMSKMITEQLKSGESYNNLKKVICIVIAANHIIVKENNRRHNRFLMRNDENDAILHDITEVDILELLKKETPNESPELKKWVDFFNAKTTDKLEKLSESKDSAISQAANAVLDLNRDEEIRVKAEQRENALRMYKTETELSEQKGRQEEKIEIAKSLKNAGMKSEFISQHTGLTAEEIEKL